MPTVFPSISGQWSGVFDWPIIGIHAILTGDGKLLTYGTNELGQQGAMLVYDVWDIATNTHYTLPNTTPTDMFCSAAAVIPLTGQILIMGGDGRAHDATHTNSGVHDVNVFDPATMTVSPLDPDHCAIGEIDAEGHICGGHMQYERWYPTAITLGNGKVVVLGGLDGSRNGVPVPELYTPWSGWKQLTGSTSAEIQKDWWYPRAWLSGNGTIEMFSSSGTTANPAKVMVMDPSGDGTFKVVGNLPFEVNVAVPSIMYEQNKILVMSSKGDCWIMDISGETPKFTKTEGLGETRLWSNMTVLADGSVMVSGGSGVLNELTNVTHEVAIWKPETGKWTIGADEALARLYHSTTILLPDATVLSLGGGAPGPLVNTNGEIYKPAYLFDKNGNLADRPEIATAPDEVKPGQQFTITVDDAASISRLTFIKEGSVTHSLNMAASKVELAFTVGPNNTLNVTLPSNSNILTPGNWMLFAINKNGTPSVASTIQVEIGGELNNKGMAGYATLNGSASYNAASDTFTLTPDAAMKRGAVMSNERVDLSKDFDIDFNIYLGSKDAGADGMTFVLHNDPWGGDATGLGGGYHGASGIRNGIAIQFDTYRNAGLGDIAQDHTDIIDTDLSPAVARITGQTSLGNIEDGKWHKVSVSWNAQDQTLVYFFDGKQAGILTGDLATKYFAGFHFAYFGFTGATGGSANLQQVQINKLDGVMEDGTKIAYNKFQIQIATLGGSATLNGNATYNAANDVFTLSPDAALKTGGVTAESRVDLNSDFDLTFSMFFGSKDGGGDGSAFVLHNDARGADALGMGGGYQGASGIGKGLAIQFDTYQNISLGDIAADHSSILDTDAPPVVSRLTAQNSLGNIEDGKWHKITVSWDADQKTLIYGVDGKLAGTLSGDLAKTYFGNSNLVYFGFTGATGIAVNLQQVHVNKIDAVLENGQHVDYTKSPVTVAEMGGEVSLNGNASYNAANHILTLTPNLGMQRGGVTSDARIDLNSDFKIVFGMNLGSKDATGADGLALVFHNDPIGSDALGTVGGFQGASGIRNGLAIRFDTYQNISLGDIAQDHSDIGDTDVSPALSRLTGQVNHGNLEDGKWHRVIVSWDASTQTLGYSVDGKAAGSLSGDLAANYFGNSDMVYFGFTGSTGGGANLQQVHVEGLDATFENGIHTAVGSQFLNA